MRTATAGLRRGPLVIGASFRTSEQQTGISAPRRVFDLIADASGGLTVQMPAPHVGTLLAGTFALRANGRVVAFFSAA